MPTTQENDSLYTKTRALIERGKTMKQAAEITGIKHGAYYIRNKAKPRKLLNVVDLPEMPSHDRAFIVYGSPKQLAEFAKGMS